MGTTVLSDLVRDWGDFLLESLTATLYQSQLFQTVLYLVAILAFLQLASDLASGARPVRPALFFICWLLVMPANGRPVYYFVINTFSVTVSDLLQKSMHQLLTMGNTKKVMPPGFVFNAIIKASSAEISDPTIRADIHTLIDDCLPDVKNKEGKPLTALDLFGGKIETSQLGVEAIILNFEPALLENRKISAPAGDTNCMALLTSTRKRMRAHLKRQDLTKMPDEIYVGPNSGEFRSRDEYVTTWDASSPRARLMANVATNLAEAHALQKTILEDYFDFPPLSEAAKYSEKAGALSPLTSISSGAFNGKRVTFMGYDFDPTRVVSEIANYPTAIAKSLNLDGAIDAGLTLQEMNERLVKLPYYISNIQLILKLLAPLVIYLLFFPKGWGIVAAWSIAWFVSLVVPAILMFSRSIANMIIIWITKLEHVSALRMGDPAFLNIGVSFEATNNLMRDAGYWMSVFLEVENGVWNALFLGLPIAGGLLAHYKGSQFMKKAGETTASTVGRESTRHAIGATRSVTKGITTTASSYAMGAGVHAANVVGKAFNRMTRFAKGGKP